MENTNLV